MTERESVVTWGEDRGKEGEITKGHRTSLAVQWLKLLAPNAGSTSLIPVLGPGTKILHTLQHSQHNSNKGTKKLLGMMGRFITFIKVMFACVETQIILYFEYAQFVVCPLYCNLKNFIGRYLLSIVLISAIYQHEPATGIHMSPLS